MTPTILFSFLAIAWALYAVPWGLKRYRGDGRALTFGMVAAFGSVAGFVLVGVLVGAAPTAMWWVLPLVAAVLVATVLAERRRSVVLRSRPKTEEPAHGGSTPSRP